MSLCAECKLPAAVGWGNPPVWLCQEHFEAVLANRDTVLFDRAVRWLCLDLEGEPTTVQADYSDEVG